MDRVNLLSKIKTELINKHKDSKYDLHITDGENDDLIGTQE